MNQENSSSQNSFKLIVFNIEKSGNIGMLIRSAYAFGCQELLVVGKTKIVVTGARGAQQVLKRRRFPSLALAVETCREDGFKVVGIEVGGKPISQYGFHQKTAFLLGNEGRGLGSSRTFCDEILMIPQWGGIPSLNVAVAGSIAMYEFQKAQNKPEASYRGEKYHDAFFDKS